MKTLRILLFLLLVSGSSSVYSQCSVCRASAESNVNKAENKVGRGLNTGILYLMAVPYAMAGIGLFVLYKSKKRVV